MIKQVRADFTLQELRAYLDGNEEAEAPEGYRTAREWAQYFGCHLLTMRETLQKAKAEGKLVIQRGKRERLDGTVYTLPVYGFLLDGETVWGGNGM